MYTHETVEDVGATNKPSNFLLHIPTALKDRLAVDAVVRGMTIRTVILQALFDAGYDVPLERRKDKRKA